MTRLDQGRSQAQVARELGVTPAAVCQWARARDEDGDEGLKARPHPGRPSKLDARQRKRLEKLLLQGPRRHGYATELWTLPRVAELIERHFGVSYDPSGVWHVLTRMGFSAQKPDPRGRRARERDEDAIAAWRKKDWPRIKKSAKARRQHGFCR